MIRSITRWGLESDFRTDTKLFWWGIFSGWYIVNLLDMVNLDWRNAGREINGVFGFWGTGALIDFERTFRLL